ncbi:hypothetical protein FHS20_003319 [Phyllobacterium endophyticum]|uniref:Uncharacterized protein n=1 Tax=Phyllobacterium endophyticum TaxID=1149773 RepID=A0A2P7ALF0_9HYPH|nr:hypothetical protein [Phyllobacterium endophyticum]PSH55038.1 hypothetical protein CU100_23330 [Phyllobacterium endophyticum]
MDKVKRYGEADAFPRTMPKPDGFGSNSPGPLIEPRFLRNAVNSISGFKSLLVCESKPTAGFPAGGQPLCQAAWDDGKASTSPPSAWIASPSEKQNYANIVARGS